MNDQHLQEIIDHYIAFFPEANGPVHQEYYKWQIIQSFRPLLDEALAASDQDFPAKLAAVKKLTRNLIDSYTQPLYGLVQFSKKEPATVRAMFQNLLQTSAGDVKQKQKAIHDFLIRSHGLREKYYPDSYLYNDDHHSVTGYLFLYDPDHNYLYKASHCRKFADCVEFYDDWGSGENTKLDVFYRMCDETLAAIRQNEALLKTAESRYDHDREHMHPDTEKHILLFDLIYCCSTYNLFNGIRFSAPKSAERQLIQARKDRAAELKKDLDEAREKAALLEAVQRIVSEKVAVGKTAQHKTFGPGTVGKVEDGRFIIRLRDGRQPELSIIQSIANGLVTVEGLELANEQMALLRDERRIRNAVSAAEKLLAPYLEYLDD